MRQLGEGPLAAASSAVVGAGSIRHHIKENAMSKSRTIAAAAIAALATTGVATAAETAHVSAQKTAKSRFAALTIPGTGVKKGARVPSGARIVFRDVTLEDGQTATLTLRAPKGKTLRGLAQAEGRKVGFVVLSKGNYAGHRQVKVRAYLAKSAQGEQTGRIYALVR
jgi:hypothetical protein